MPSLEEKIEHGRPADVCALISDAILRRHGNEVQDNADVDCSHGYYRVRYRANGADVDKRLRRKDVAAFIKGLRKS
jgi:hypothetical protein